MRRVTLKISDPATAFRLPKTILATIDLICAKQDLTRSQVFRRSVVEYLKSQNAIVTDPNAPKPQEEWFAEWYQGRRRKSPSPDAGRKFMGLNHAIAPRRLKPFRAFLPERLRGRLEGGEHQARD